MGSTKAEQCTYKQFDNNPGLYFETIGKMALTHDTWNIICVLRMNQLWSQIDELDSLLHQLAIICSKIKPPKLCNLTNKQLAQQITLLKEQSELIQQFSHKHLMRKRRGWSDNDAIPSLSGETLKRSKRGWINIVGSGFKTVTGLMDNDDSERIQQQVQLLNDSFHHTMKMMADQTSIQDITQNIIKNDEVKVSKQFTVVKNEILELRNITLEASHFDALSVQALSVIENNRERISAIIDLITQVRHGHVSTVLITPHQLSNNLDELTNEIDKRLMIPGDGLKENLVHLYKLINAEISMGKQNLIIKLGIPLIEQETYDMFHIIPVPFQNDNSEMQIIQTTSQYICINNRQDKYYMVSNEEKVACKAFFDGMVICEQKHMLFNTYNGSAECEMAIFSHSSKSISPRCTTMRLSSEQVWSKLHATNTFLFTTKTKTIFNIICENGTMVCHAKGSGIIQMRPRCILQTSNYEIVSDNDITVGEINIIIPQINISEILIELTPTSTVEYEQDNMQQDEYMTDLQHAIQQQKKQLENIPNYHPHNIHHYTMVYALLIGMVALVGITIWWISKNKRTFHQREHDDPVSAQPHASFEQKAVSFSQ